MVLISPLMSRIYEVLHFFLLGKDKKWGFRRSDISAQWTQKGEGKALSSIYTVGKHQILRYPKHSFDNVPDVDGLVQLKY